HGRVTGAGDVVDLDRLGGKMVCAVGVEQGHAIVTAGDQNGAEAVPLAERGSGGDHRGLGVDRHAGRGGEVGAIRHNEVGTCVARIVGAARVDDDGTAGLAGAGDQLRCDAT